MIVTWWLQVVEHDQRVGDHQRHVGRADVVGVRLGQALDGAHEVVAEHADRAARERRQVVERRQAVAGQVVGDGAERVGPVELALRAVQLASRRASVPSKRRIARGPEAEERVAAEALALLGRLEQERRARGRAA